MAARPNHTAAPQVAGLILQVQRALHHLSQAAANEAVAVELVDDVSLSRSGKTIAQEQDKNSVRPSADLLGDRSNGLWRTIQIWLQGYQEAGQQFCERYFLVTNVSTTGHVIQAIKAARANQIPFSSAVEAMRAAAMPRSRTKIQTLIDDVLLATDETLESLLSRVEVVENYDAFGARADIANGLGIDPGVDKDQVLEALFGWIINALQELWQQQKPGVITREACLRQCRALESSLARRRLLPRPPADLNIGEEERTSVKSRPFVDHLTKIEAMHEDVIQAIDHFLQFNIERHRLVAEGEIPTREWADRGERLKLRWRNIVRRVRLEHEHRTRTAQGRLILADTTYQHHEPLAGEACHELYMTSGHYHRLADEDAIWWDPDHTQEN